MTSKFKRKKAIVPCESNKIGLTTPLGVDSSIYAMFNK